MSHCTFVCMNINALSIILQFNPLFYLPKLFMFLYRSLFSYQNSLWKDESILLTYKYKYEYIVYLCIRERNEKSQQSVSVLK